MDSSSLYKFLVLSILLFLSYNACSGLKKVYAAEGRVFDDTNSHPIGKGTTERLVDFGSYLKGLFAKFFEFLEALFGDHHHLESQHHPSNQTDNKS
jgi:hypothetical protein